MPLRSITFLVYFFCSSAAALAYPMIGVVCYIVLYHVYPETTWWGRALRPLGIRYAFVAGICVLIGVTLNLNRMKFGRRILHPIELGVLSFLLVTILSTAWGSAWDARTEFLLEKMAKVILFALTLSHVVVTREKLWQITVLFTALTYYLGHEATIAPPGSFANNRLDGIGGPDFRESAGLAIHLFALMPFVAVVFRQRAWALKAMAFLAGCYGINGILLCRARSAFVAGVVAGVMALWYVPRRHRRWVACILVLGLIGGVVLSDNWFWVRMATILDTGEERDESAASRFEIWAAAWNMVKENPLGVGIGHFEEQIGRYGPETVRGRDAHNTYVLCAGELGVPGLVVYVATVVAAWLTLGRVHKRVRSELSNTELFELLIFAARLALIVYMVSGIFVSRLYTEGAWWLIVLPACLVRAVENECRSPVQQVLLDDRDGVLTGMPAGTTVAFQ